MTVHAIPRYGQLGPTACLLVDVLKEGKPGDTISDEKLTEVCGKNTEPHGDGYPSLMSAIRYVTVMFGIRWKRVPKLQLLSVLKPSERVQEEVVEVRAICRKVRRAARRSSSISLSELSEEEKQKLLAVSAQYGAIELMSNPETTKVIESKSAGDLMDPKKVLELFAE